MPEKPPLSKPSDFVPAPGVLDNTQITQASQGRYIAHVAVPCNDLDETARWYATVLGAQPVRILRDRVTFSVGGVLQLVCHLERRGVDPDPRAYPRHAGLTFLEKADFKRMCEHISELGIEFLMNPQLRFAGSDHEHETFMLVDPSNNVVEFKCYVKPEFSY